MGKSYALIKTQYIYVNSTNRKDGDYPYKFSITIPPGLFHCDEPTQFFKVSLQNFNAIASWYYVNNTNNQFYFNDGYGPCLVTIVPGNYRFKDLATAIETAITKAYRNIKVCSVTWSSTLNKFIFQFDNDGYTYSLNFTASNSAYYILGFENQTTYTLNSNRTITSVNTLKTTLSENICLTIDNLTPTQQNTSVENVLSDVCTPSKNILSIPNNFAPNDVITYIQQGGDLFPLYIKEKKIEALELSVRDEDGDLMQYFTDWRGAIKVETYQTDSSYEDSQKMLEALHDIRDYLKYMFVMKGLPQS